MGPAEVVVLNIKVPFASSSCIIESNNVFFTHLPIVCKYGTVYVLFAEEILNAVFIFYLLSLYYESEPCFRHKIIKLK